MPIVTVMPDEMVGTIPSGDSTRNPMKSMNNRKTLAVLLGGMLMVTASNRVSTSNAQQPARRPVNTSPIKPVKPFAAGPVANAVQTEEQPILQTIQLPPERLVDIADSLGLKYGYTPHVNVTYDTANSSLVIMAPPSLQVQMANEIQLYLASGVIQRAGRTVSTATVSRQFPLRSITWREFEDVLQSLTAGQLQGTTRRNGELASFELVDQPIGKATVEVDRRANAVTIVAPEPRLLGWQTLIQNLDMQGGKPGEVLELAKIKNAEPAPIQRAIRLLRQLKSADAPAGGGDAIGVAGNGVRFTGANFTQQAGQQDPQQDFDPNNPNNFNNPNQIPGDELPMDEMPVDEPGDEEGGLFGDVQIQFVPELGVIIVKGAKRDVERVMKVIDDIEKAADQTQPVIEVLELEHIDSEATADLVRQLYTDLLNTRGSNLSITGLVKPNALLLIGRAEAVQAATELVKKLDQPVDAASQLRVFRLEHASAVDAEGKIRSFFSTRPGIEDEELRPVLGTRVRIISDFRTNSLIVQAAPRDLEEVTRLIEELDVALTAGQDEIKVFPLKNALAEELQPVLQEAITGQTDDFTAPDGFTKPSTSLSIVAVDSESNRLIESGVLVGAVVRADANANALVVRAPAASMPLIAELIRQLDTLPGAETVIKVFQLENGDATSISTALTELFTAQGDGGGGGPVQLSNVSASAESSLVPLRFSTDIRTNSVVAVGSLSDLEVVESVVLRLDTEGFAARQTEVIWLRNARASDVATAITSYVTARRTGINTIQQIQQGGAGVYDLPDRDLIVVPEDISNSLLLSVSPRLYDNIRRVIDQLDRRLPMIMAKVLIAEINIADGFEWGSEFGIQDSLLFDRGVAGVGGASLPGFNFNNAGTSNLNGVGQGDLAGRAVSTFGLGATSADFGYGGFVLSAASDSVSLLLRSLQDANRLQVLSRPMIMTRDSSEALVQVGQTVARVNGIVATGLAIQTVVADVEIGLILRIIPRVGADGLIRMEIDAQRSNLGPLIDGTPIGTDTAGNVIISPPINITRAQSVLNAYSGQTVIFGGLIQKTRQQFSRRVPYISSIPVLGRLFRYDQETEVRSELLIIITPMVVSGDEDLEYVKYEESSKMSYCIGDVVEMHGDVGLSGGYGLWGPAVGPMIYPDVTPTIDDIEMMYPRDNGLYENPMIEAPYPNELNPNGYSTDPYSTDGYNGQPSEFTPRPMPPMQMEPRLPMPPGGNPGDLPNATRQPAVPGLVEPTFPVQPIGHVRQVQHADPAVRPVGQQPRRTPRP